MKKWAYTVTVLRRDVTGSSTITNYIRTLLGFVEAANKEEATGKALALGLHAYPKKVGWVDHSVMVRDCETTVDTLENFDIGDCK